MSKKLNIYLLEDEVDQYPREAFHKALAGHNVTIAKSVIGIPGRPRADKIYAENVPDSGYDLLVLDHDMEGDYEKITHPNTGTPFAKWLVDQPWPIPFVILHSHNNPGRASMRKILETAGVKGSRIVDAPFPQALGILKTLLAKDKSEWF